MGIFDASRIGRRSVLSVCGAAESMGSKKKTKDSRKPKGGGSGGPTKKRRKTSVKDKSHDTPATPRDGEDGDGGEGEDCGAPSGSGSDGSDGSASSSADPDDVAAGLIDRDDGGIDDEDDVVHDICPGPIGLSDQRP